MIITIIAVSKTKKKFVLDGIDEYTKRIAKYARLKWVFVEPSSAREVGLRIKEETSAIIKQIDTHQAVYILDKTGTQFSSESFAGELDTTKALGKIMFVIGGSDGMDLRLFGKHSILSFSKSTFEHDLIRLILLEQVYRALDINAEGHYHK